MLGERIKKYILYKSSRNDLQRWKMHNKNLYDFNCSSTIYFFAVQMTEDEMDGAFVRIREREEKCVKPLLRMSEGQRLFRIPRCK